MVTSPAMLLTLFGDPQLYTNGLPSRLTSRRAYRILARIALLRGGKIGRRELAASLWPELDARFGASTLRREIERIEAAWRDAGNVSNVFAREGRAIAFAADARLEIDALRFEAFCTSGALAEAAACYTGDLCAGDTDAAIVAERERFQARLAEVLERLIEEARVEGQLSSAIAYATRLQTFEPYRDQTVRALMQHRSGAADRRKPFRVDREAAAESAVRLRRPAAGTARGRLPAEQDTFVGRDREIAQIAGILSRRRLITITGAPGMGKSRLAVRLARLHEIDFPSGAYFLDFTTASSAADIERIAIDALAGDARGPGDTLESVLAARAALVVFDNCEHLLQECAAVVEYVLAVSPATKILATSRRPLHIPAEVEWRLAPLDLPASGGDDSDAALAPAVRLFLERAEAVQPTGIFQTPIAIAVSICAMLDGVPLALELAASRLRVTTFAELENLVRERLPVLVDPYREARQMTLEAPYAWSYALLSPPAQRAFRSLAVFAGGFTLDAARAVCAAAGSAEAGAALDEVIDHSMLVATAAETASSRYKLLFSAYEFARQMLDESGEGAAVRADHARYFIAEANRYAGSLAGPERERVYPILRTESDNVVAALREAIVGGVDVERGLEACVALSRFWTDAYRNAEGLQLIEAALPNVDGETELAARALQTASVLARQSGDIADAIGYAEAACEATAKLGDANSESHALAVLGNAYTIVGNIEGALAVGNEALVLARDLRSAEAEVYASLMVAQAELSLDKVAEARRGFARAVELGTQCGSVREALIGLNNLAICALLEDDLVNAAQYAQAALERGRALMLPENIAWALSVRASVAWRTGDRKNAVAYSEELVAAARLVDASILEIFVLEEAARALIALGDLSLAAKLFGAVDAARKQYDQPLQPIEEPPRARADAAMTAALGAIGFDAAHSIGSTWSLKEAIGEALSRAKGVRDIRV